jgi:hypothetical protein
MTIFSSRAVALPFPPGGPGAVQIKCVVVVDNCFQVWTGSNSEVKEQEVPTTQNRSSLAVMTAAEKPFDYVPGSYIYIIAWSDNKTNQGVLGQFSYVGSSQAIYTGDPRWKVLPTNEDFDNNTAPTKDQINQYLNADPIGSTDPNSKWTTPITGPANVTGNKPFGWVAAKVSASARWMWHDGQGDPRAVYPLNPSVDPYVPFTSPPGAVNIHHEFLIFAIPQDDVPNIPPPSLPPPDLYAEQLFDDNKFALTPVDQSGLWSSGDAETDLDFLVAWMVDHAADMKFDANLFGLGVGVRVDSGPKTSIAQEVVLSATNQQDNSTPNAAAPGNAGIRYADGRVYVFPSHEVVFVVEGFVSPLRATLKEEFTNANQAISLAELQTYDARLPKDSAGRTQYNPLLSALRAVGLFEAMVNRIIDHVDELFPSPDAATATKISTLKTGLEALKLNAVGNINISNTWWDVKVTYPSYRKIKDN